MIFHRNCVRCLPLCCRGKAAPSGLNTSWHSWLSLYLFHAFLCLVHGPERSRRAWEVRNEKRTIKLMDCWTSENTRTCDCVDEATLTQLWRRRTGVFPLWWPCGKYRSSSGDTIYYKGQNTVLSVISLTVFYTLHIFMSLNHINLDVRAKTLQGH